MRGVAERALNRSLSDLATIQQDVNVRLALENMGAWDICFFREPGFLARLADGGLGFALDVGHAHVNGNLGPFLEEGGAIHVHLHDNCGNRDDHLACGEGSIDFRRVLQVLPSARRSRTGLVSPARKHRALRPIVLNPQVLRPINRSTAVELSEPADSCPELGISHP